MSGIFAGLENRRIFALRNRKESGCSLKVRVRKREQAEGGEKDTIYLV